MNLAVISNILKDPIYIILALLFILNITAGILLLYIRRSKKIAFNVKIYLEEIVFSFRDLISILYNIWIVIVLVRILADLFKLKWIANITKSTVEFIKNNQQISGVFIGAFLASLLGIVTQLFLTRLNRNRDVRKYSRLLHNEINNILRALRLATIYYRDGSDSNGNKEHAVHFNIMEEIYYDPMWRDYFTYISDQLPLNYYNRISEIYHAADKYNKVVRERNLELYSRFFYDLIEINDDKPDLLGLPITTNDEILNALQKLSQNKKIRKRVIYNLTKELIYYRKKAKIYNSVKDQILNLLKTEGETDTDIVIERIKEWLNKQDGKTRKRYKEEIDRITFEILIHSSEISVIWGTCKLKENL